MCAHDIPPQHSGSKAGVARRRQATYAQLTLSRRIGRSGYSGGFAPGRFRSSICNGKEEALTFDGMGVELTSLGLGRTSD
jgi:hypothetical protein